MDVDADWIPADRIGLTDIVLAAAYRTQRRHPGLVMSEAMAPRRRLEHAGEGNRTGRVEQLRPPRHEEALLASRPGGLSCFINWGDSPTSVRQNLGRSGREVRSAGIGQQQRRRAYITMDLSPCIRFFGAAGLGPTTPCSLVGYRPILQSVYTGYYLRAIRDLPIVQAAHQSPQITPNPGVSGTDMAHPR